MYRSWMVEWLDGNITSFRSWLLQQRRRERAEEAESDCKNHRRRRRRRLVWVAVHNHGSFTFEQRKRGERETTLFVGKI